MLRDDRSVLDLLHRRLHLPQRAPGAALRHHRREGRPVPPREARRIRRASACWARARVLMVTAYPNRTSPVLRGAWILERIMGTPPAHAAARTSRRCKDTNAGEKPADGARADRDASRNKPQCYACHGVHGSARLRARELRRRRASARAHGPLRARRRSTPRASCPMARKVRTARRPARRAARATRSQFVQTLTEKLMTYALGRAIEYARHAARCAASCATSAADDYRFRRSSCRHRARATRSARPGVPEAKTRPPSSRPLRHQVEESTMFITQEASFPPHRAAGARAPPSRCRCWMR